MADKDSIL